VDSLVYFKQVIDETLRLYPPIHVGNRVSAEDLSVCGYDIPKGERVMVSIYATHHDETHWPEPERFDPERFGPGKQHTPYSYLPFGGGARNCLGANFAQVEAKVVLARIFQRYELTLTRPRVHIHMGATLEPRPGCSCGWSGDELRFCHPGRRRGRVEPGARTGRKQSWRTNPS
jgi:cytochrome P450